jgi:hypothetical protein
MTGIIHMLNQTPIHWFSKHQGRVQSATYGSEFMAAHTATEQIMDLRYTLLMMGRMVGDNQSVTTSSTIHESSLNKQNNTLSYHLVRECIAVEINYFIHVEGKFNPSDLFTKILGWAEFWPLIQLLFFWKGETIIPEKPLPEIIKEIKA